MTMCKIGCGPVCLQKPKIPNVISAQDWAVREKAKENLGTKLQRALFLKARTSLWRVLIEFET